MIQYAPSYPGISVEPVLRYFEAISAIPRGSGNEKAISDYVAAFAKDHALSYQQDGANNVIIRRPAIGMPAGKPIVFQGHMDMVCEANSNVQHDFLHDPITVLQDGDVLHADGTTLGADNGIAIAMMLAILEDTERPCPALECIFTTEEETGMFGMHALDASSLTGRCMINLDSSGEGAATIACAGGVRTDFVFPCTFQPLPAGWRTYSLSITKLAGGHSGENIHLGLANAIYTLICALAATLPQTQARLISMHGGSKENAIPRECTITFASPAEADTILSAWLEENLMPTLVAADAECSYSVDTVSSAAAAMSVEDSATLLSAMHALPVGVLAMSKTIPDLVETSSNLGILRSEEDGIHFTLSSRSSVDASLDAMEERLARLASAHGMKASHRGRYPGWAPISDSTLQRCYKETWKALYGTEAQIIGIHAGLECGLFMQKVPDMDIISIGPDICAQHSPDERVTISSIERLYQLVLEMLKKLA